MESASNLLIVVDAGHGGWDNGASFEGRLEKDDNLRLALEVRDQLAAQGIQVIMTRDDDTFVPLADRAAIANQADADLFVSLHRNSYPEQTPSAQGVENFIYLTAPQETSGLAAQLVLNEVVEVGAQSDRGVSRGNYAVLRRTKMPAMLLEMGFINNEIDNQLFDDNLEAYAAAIARGVMRYFGMPFRENVSDAVAASGQAPQNAVTDMQNRLEARYGFGLTPSGRYDNLTRRAGIVALQIELNGRDAGLSVDGILGPKTIAAIPNVRQGDTGDMVTLLQVLLTLNGYNPGEADGKFGPRTATALRFFQRDHYLIPDGIAGKETFPALVQM